MEAHSIIEMVALIAGGALAGNEFAVGVFVQPTISRFDDATHTEAAKALADVLGRCMPFWYALVLLLSGVVSWISYPQPGTLRWFALSATLLWALSIIYTLTSLVPINNKIAKWDLKSLPEEWRIQRKTWDRRHRYRIVILIAAEFLMSAAIFTKV